MTVKTSGPLSFDNDIEAEFGENPSRSLGSYRNTHPDFGNKNCGSLTDLPLDTGIPKSGEIKFSHFYGKKLNIVVDYYSVSENRQQAGASSMAATARYVSNNNKVKIVGDYQTKPTAILNPGTYNLTNATTNASWQGGKKVIINVNATIGGIKATVNHQSHRQRVALRTGGWPSGTSLQIDIGPSGRLQGAGGNGRKGGGSQPAKALPGTSALGVEYAAHINKSGIIRCGYGGGGGGGGSSSNPGKSKTDYGRSAGAGGGGAGIPAGAGGPQGTGGYGGTVGYGQAGQNGTQDAGGNVGPFTPPNFDQAAGGFGVGADHGGNSGGGVKAGNGGNGGDINNPAATGGTAGVRQGGGTFAAQGGAGGDNGFGIIFGNSSIESASTGFKSTPNNEGGDTASGGIY